MRRWLLLCVLIMGVQLNPVPINESMYEGSVFYEQSQTESIVQYQSTSFVHQFADTNFQLGSRVFERSAALQTDVYSDFNSNRNTLYHPAHGCTLSKTSFNWTNLASLQLQVQVEDYAYLDQAVLVIGGGYLALILIDQKQESLNLVANLSLQESSSLYKLVILNNSAYLITFSKIFRVIRDRNTIKIEQVAKNLPSPTPFLSPETILSVRVLNDTVYVAQPHNISLCQFSTPTSCSCRTLALIYNTTIQDLLVDEQYLYVLNNSSALITITNNEALVLTQYTLPYQELGVNKRFQKVLNTIEVVFQLLGRSYIMELKVKDGVPHLNRLYDTVLGIRRLDFWDNKLLIVGEDEVAIINHSANRLDLLQMSDSQNFKSVASRNIQDLSVLSKRNSKPGVSFFLGVGANFLTLAKVKILPIELACTFSQSDRGKRTLMVQMNATNCGSYSWLMWHHAHQYNDTICIIRKVFQFTIKPAIYTRKARLYSIGLVFLLVIMTILTCFCTAKWRRSMHLIILEHQSRIKESQSIKPYSQSTEQI